jgi:ferredoxin-NADP reductase
MSRAVALRISGCTDPPEQGVAMSTTHLETNLDLVVRSRHDAAAGVVTLDLCTGDGSPLPSWEPGAHVDLHLGADGPDGTAMVRQYSLCGDPGDRSYWRVAVLREPAGRGGSRFVHDELVAGATVHVRGPRNHFPFRQSKRYLFIGGGIGITPLIPMMAAAGASGAQWTLAYGGRSRESMAFVDELVAAHGDRVSVCPQDSRGLLDLPALLGRPQPDTEVYCCGPEPLLAAVESMCAHWPTGALHVERFAPKEVGERVVAGPFEVEIVSTGKVLTVTPEQTVLEVLQNNGVHVVLPLLARAAPGQGRAVLLRDQLSRLAQSGDRGGCRRPGRQQPERQPAHSEGRPSTARR